MDLTTKDLELLVNDQNKEIYHSMYDMIIEEFSNALNFIDVNNITEERKAVLGNCGIYLSSLVELLHTLRDLIDNGYIESGGAIATSCWERALTLRMLLTNPVVNGQVITFHQKAKSTPWGIYEMVCKVIENEHKINNTSRNHQFEEKNFYLQYTFLSSIKHGNPYTVHHLYREDYSSNKELFHLKPNDSFEDKDLKIYIKMLAADNALDALIDFSREFRTNYNSLKELRIQINELISQVKLEIPKIFITTPQELGQGYWDHLADLQKNHKI